MKWLIVFKQFMEISRLTRLSNTISKCDQFVQKPELHRQPTKIYECWRDVLIFAVTKNNTGQCDEVNKVSFAEK